MTNEKIDLLKKLLNIPSVNGMDNEKNMAYALKEYLCACGVTCNIQEIDSTHGNIIATLDGESEEYVMWNGHIDTVPYGDLSKWNTDPQVAVEKNGQIYARGASDMKSGLAAMVYALGYMKKQNIVPKHNLIFLGSCDEEKNGIGATYYQKNIGVENIKEIIIGEPTNLAIGVAQKGCLWLELVVKGVTSHGAYPEQGCNAIENGVLLVNKLKEKVGEEHRDFLGLPTIQITKIEGGIANNMTPDYGKIILDIRFNSLVNKEMIFQWLEEIMEELAGMTDNKLEVEYHHLSHRRAIEIDFEHPLLKNAENQLTKHNIEVKHLGINYFTDGSVLTRYKDIPMILFGAGNPVLAHKANESVDINQYLTSIDVLIDMVTN